MKEGWRNKRIDEITYLITDGDWIESRHQSDDGFRLIQTGNIGRGIFKSKDDKPHFISETTFKELSCTEIFEGDCLISRLPDPVGRSCLIPNIGNRMITAVDCTILRFKKEIMPPFFVYYTQSNRYSKEIEGNVTGATRKRISRKNLEKIQVPIPPLSEQQRIVEELDLLSSIIEKKKAQIKELDNLAQSLFYEMFGDPIINEKGWEVKKLKEACTCITDGDHMPPPKVDKGIPFITISNIDKQNREIDFRDTFFVPQSYYDSINKERKAQIDDVLYTVTGSYGIPIIVKEDRNFCFQRHIALLRPNKHLVSPCYLCYWALCKSIKYLADDVATGIAQKTVGLSSLREFPIIIPPLALQQQFASKIEAIEHQKEFIKQSIKEVETLFNSRMDYYFN